MIKFFRKIRQILVSEGNTKVYIKYAIGEIILVIVGILIALQLNNLNEQRKVSNEMTDKIKALTVNLEDEIGVSGAFSHPKKIENVQRFLDGELNLDSLRIHPEYIDLSKVIIKDDILEETIDILVKNEDRLPDRYKGLIPKMKSLKFYFSTYKSGLQDLRELKRNNVGILENNYVWYSHNDSISNEKRLQHYTTDPLFRNRLSSILQKYRRCYEFYSRTIIIKLEILCAIKRADGHYTSDDFRSYLQSSTFMGTQGSYFNEGIKMSCDTETHFKVKVGSSHLLLNTSSDTISINNNPRNVLPPNTSRPYITSLDNGIIQLYRKNSCEAYQLTTTNFIIIE